MLLFMTAPWEKTAPSKPMMGEREVVFLGSSAVSCVYAPKKCGCLNQKGTRTPLKKGASTGLKGDSHKVS